MAKTLSTRVLLVVVSIIILAVSIGLYAALTEDELYDCAKYCGDKYFPDNAAFFACMEGCIFIKEQ